MKAWKVPIITAIAVILILLSGFAYKQFEKRSRKSTAFVPPSCVFKTVMGEESSENFSRYKTPEAVSISIDRGLSWVSGAQNQNGGWGSGSHARQHIMDPHAVPADPATTSMVAMALLRSGTTLTKGTYTAQLKRALNYLLEAVESSQPQSPTITTETGTQIQTKLGQNIDVILTAQFLSNVLDYTQQDMALKNRVSKALDICVKKIQRNQEEDGSIRGAGWAGVLQSSLANNALESAQAKGAHVDDDALERSRSYQKGNYDAKTGEAKTERGAGVVLYAVTGSARASAKEARKVKEEIESAKRSGRLAQNAPVSAESLEKIGYKSDEAMRYATSYDVYQSAKTKAQQEDIMDGFGSNGGEEFISYLQTGESMMINKDNEWQKWYDNITGKLINIQNNDGSWNGHHCITSPVFCTATCILILSINNDIEKFTEIGAK